MECSGKHETKKRSRTLQRSRMKVHWQQWYPANPHLGDGAQGQQAVVRVAAQLRHHVRQQVQRRTLHPCTLTCSWGGRVLWRSPPARWRRPGLIAWGRTGGSAALVCMAGGTGG